MNDATLGQLIVAVTAVLSGSLGLAGGLLIEQIRTKRDRAARLEARQNVRDDFQQQTLLELQEAVARFGRAVGGANYQDAMEYKDSGSWGRSPISHESSEEFLAAQVRLMALQERVRDAQLRKLVTRFHNYGALVPTAREKDVATKRMDDWIETLTAVQERLGTVLRELL